MLQAHKAQLDQWELQALPVQLEQPALQAHKAQQAHKVRLVQQVRQEQLELPVLQEQQVHKDQPARMELIAGIRIIME